MYEYSEQKAIIVLEIFNKIQSYLLIHCITTINIIIFFPSNSLSVAIIVAALAGPQWLFTEERLSKSYLNGTVLYKPRGDDSDYVTKFTKSSLWILCTDLGKYTQQQEIAQYNEEFFLWDFCFIWFSFKSIAKKYLWLNG